MITSEEMRDLEEKAVQEGVSLLELMENAGKQVYEAVRERTELEGKEVIVLAGPGNNGGDGFVAARYFSMECPVQVFYFGEEDKLSEEARENYERIKEGDGVKMEVLDEDSDLPIPEQEELVIVDALLGLGAKGELREPIATAANLYNSLTGYKVAVDVPTGVDPDTGEVQDNACEPNVIVTFHDTKPGLGQFKEVEIKDIGIPKNL